MKRTGKIVITLVTVSLLVLTAACAPAVTEEEVTPTPTVEWGIIEIWVTDPPPAKVKSANVTLAKIEVHREGAGWVKVMDAVPSFDLLEVSLVSAKLGAATSVTGNYTGIRMDVIEVSGNMTDEYGGGWYTANVTSGKLRIVRPFNVGAGLTTVLTLDFVGEKCLIRTGKGTYLFKPVVKLTIAYEELP